MIVAPADGASAGALKGGAGGDRIDGGNGVDVAIYDGPLSDFSITSM